MVKQEVPIEDLRLGMYVVELDRPWLGTRFVFQGFTLTSPEQIDHIRSYCKRVYVDPERAQWEPPPRVAGAIQGTTTYAEVHSVAEEMPLAREIHQSCVAALAQLQESLHGQGAIQPGTLSRAVASMTASIQRNPDAMLLLNTLHRKDSHALARALDTAILMITFGRFLRLATARLEVLGLAGMLLDVGMARLPDDAATPGAAAYDPHDSRVQAHVMLSVELLRAAQGLPRGVEEIVTQHHERQDGKGYPSGLTADAISMDGAHAAIVDAYVELTSARPGGVPASPSNALGQMHKLRGTHYHAALVEQFIQCIGIYPVGSAVELNSGETAIVVAQNLVRRLQPRVMVIFDADGMLTHPLRILDLLRELKTAEGVPYRIGRALARDKLPFDAAELFL